MGIAVLACLFVFALVDMPVSHATGSCPTLFNFYSHATDCTKFYRCFWGSPIEFVCPKGTHWNQHILTCDHAYNVPCITAVVNPVYTWVKDDGYAVVKKDYVKDNYGSYETKKQDFTGSYGNPNEYPSYVKDNYGSYETKKQEFTGTYGKPDEYPSYVKNYYDNNYLKNNDYNLNYFNGQDYSSDYVKQGDYKYNQYWGTAGETKQTHAPTIGHNYGGFEARAGYNQYGNNDYGRTGHITTSYSNPTYSGYAVGGYASKAASGYARSADPVVGRIFGKPSLKGKKYGSKTRYPWKK